jgi:DNA invertase Pin-like site-specific DNA recombinase
VGYARVSTEGQTLEQQFTVLRDAGCEIVFGEKVSSTVPSEKRAQLQAALASLTAGDTLVVSKLDRLGRTQSEVVSRLASLQDQGVYVRTLDGLLNTASLGKMAPLVVGLLTGLAEVERSLIQERTRESVEHRRRTGGKLGGRPPLPEGRVASKSMIEPIKLL